MAVKSQSSSHVLQIMSNIENNLELDMENYVAKTLLSSGQWLIYCVQFCGYWPLSTGRSRKVNESKLSFELFSFNPAYYCTIPVFMSFCWLSCVTISSTVFIFVMGMRSVNDLAPTTTGVYAAAVYITSMTILVSYLKCKSLFRRKSYCSVWRSMVKLCHRSIQIGNYRNLSDFDERFRRIRKETQRSVVFYIFFACFPIFAALCVLNLYDKNDPESRGYNNGDNWSKAVAIFSMMNTNFHYICCTPWIIFLLKVDNICCDLLDNEFAGYMTNGQDKIDFYHQLEFVVTAQNELFQQDFAIDLFIGFVQVTGSIYFTLESLRTLSSLMSFFLIWIPGLMTPILCLVSLFNVCSQASMISDKCRAIGKRIEASGFHCLQNHEMMKASEL